MLPGLGGQVVVDGQFTSVKVQQVVLAIKEMYPDIEVGWIPPAAREKEDGPAYRISYEPPGAEPYILFYVTENEMDERVLKRIIQNDLSKFPQGIGDLEAWELAQHAIKKQEWLDELEAANDIAFRAFRSHKNTYRVSPNLVIKEGIPHNAAHLDEQGRKKKGSPDFDIRKEMM